MKEKVRRAMNVFMKKSIINSDDEEITKAMKGSYLCGMASGSQHRTIQVACEELLSELDIKFDIDYDEEGLNTL